MTVALTPRSALNNEDGFTLLEMLTVVVIIGILAAIATPLFLKQKNAASDASLKGSLLSLSMHITPRFNEDRALSLVKEDFVGVSLDQNVSWDVSKTTPQGYCAYVWNEGNADYNSPQTSMMFETREGVCASEGITGTIGL